MKTKSDSSKATRSCSVNQSTRGGWLERWFARERGECFRPITSNKSFKSCVQCSLLPFVLRVRLIEFGACAAIEFCLCAFVEIISSPVLSEDQMYIEKCNFEPYFVMY